METQNQPTKQEIFSRVVQIVYNHEPVENAHRKMRRHVRSLLRTAESKVRDFCPQLDSCSGKHKGDNYSEKCSVDSGTYKHYKCNYFENDD